LRFLAGFAFPLRLEQPLGTQHDDNATRGHHRQEHRRLDDRRSTCRLVGCVETFDVERAQFVFDQAGQL
jgi:hypothetical protein